jgi:hypothetical protein
MDRNSRLGVPDKAIQTVCVGGVYVINKRIGYDRRHRMPKCQKEYERRLSNCSKNFKRRRQFIDIVV